MIFKLMYLVMVHFHSSKIYKTEKKPILKIKFFKLGLGLCLYELFTRKVPIPRKPAKMYAFDTEEFKQAMAPETPQVIYTLVGDCCQTEPRHRIPFRQILKTLNQVVEDAPDEPIRWKVGGVVGKKGSTKTLKLKKGAELKDIIDDPNDVLMKRMTISRISNPSKRPTTNTPNPRPSNSPSQRPVSSVLQNFSPSVDKPRGQTEIKPGTTKVESQPTQPALRDIKIGNQRSASVSLGSPSTMPLKKFSKDEEAKFLKACIDGDIATVKSMLQPAVDLSIYNREGESPLFVAVKYGHLKVVEIILPLLTQIQINTPTKSGSYALHQACKGNLKSIAQMLVDAGAKLKTPDKQKNYPLHIACESGSPEIVQLLLEKGGKSILETCNEQGETPLLTAYRCGHRPVIVLLHQNQANSWVVDRDGRTPLIYAVKQGDIEFVRQLISFGCELDHATEGN